MPSPMNLVATFNEAILFGVAGALTLKRYDDDSTVETFDVVADAGTKLSIAGAALTITPVTTLTPATYYVVMPSGAIRDVAGNLFAGISNKDAWSFVVSGGGGIAAPAGYYNFATNSFPTYAPAGAAVKAGTGHGRIAIVSGSIGASAGAGGGLWAAGAASLSWPYKMADLMATAGIAVSKKSFFSDHNISFSGGGWPAFDSRLSIGSGWSVPYETLPSFGGCLIGAGALAGGFNHFAPGSAWDTFELYDICNGAGFGPLAYGISETPAIASLDQTLSQRLRKTTGSVTRAVQDFIWWGGGELTFMSGLILRDSTVKAMDIVNASAGSWGTIKWTSNTPAAWDPMYGLAAIAPDLTIFAQTANDAGSLHTGDITTSQYKTNLNAEIDAAKLSGDVLLVSEHKFDPSSVDYTTQQAIRDAMREVSDARSIPMIDLWEILGDYTTRNGAGKMADYIHQTALGNDDYAAAISLATINPNVLSN